RRHGGKRTADPNDDKLAKVTIGMFDGSSRWMKLGDLAALAGQLGAYNGGPPPVLPSHWLTTSGAIPTPPTVSRLHFNEKAAVPDCREPPRPEFIRSATSRHNPRRGESLRG